MPPPQYYQAVQLYTQALCAAPWAAVLYTNRCLALLQRGWEGDAAAALRDAEMGARDGAGACMHAKACVRARRLARRAGQLAS